MLSLNRVYCVEARDGLRRLLPESVDCVLTSPPYWGLRDYGNPEVTWSDGSSCALGLESDFTVYIAHLVQICDEIQRVLKKTGTLWVNLGDIYAGSWGNYAPEGITSVQREKATFGKRWKRPAYADTRFRPPSSRKQHTVRAKSLCLIPARFALEMTRRQWILRNIIVWHKPNHMPSSIKDRFACSWEHIFFFVKESPYSFDLDAVRMHHTCLQQRSTCSLSGQARKSHSLKNCRLPPEPGDQHAFHPLGKNPGDCWSISTCPHREAHFAVFPEKLCEIRSQEARGRKFLGFDANPDYVRMAKRRLQRERTKNKAA